jgi:hypothetical protein
MGLRLYLTFVNKTRDRQEGAAATAEAFEQTPPEKRLQYTGIQVPDVVFGGITQPLLPGLKETSMRLF